MTDLLVDHSTANTLLTPQSRAGRRFVRRVHVSGCVGVLGSVLVPRLLADDLVLVARQNGLEVEEGT